MDKTVKCKITEDVRMKIIDYKITGKLENMILENSNVCPNCRELEALFDMQHKRTGKADKLWQKAHNKPDVLPDLGVLVDWLMSIADMDKINKTCDPHCLCIFDVAVPPSVKCCKCDGKWLVAVKYRPAVVRKIIEGSGIITTDERNGQDS